MPKLRNKLPSYRLHKVSGQAVVTLNGRDIYLGRYNSAESREKYQRAIKEWLTSHRLLPPEDSRGRRARATDSLTINEIFASYWEYVQQYYRKYGKPTSEVSSIKRALAPVLEEYGSQLAKKFGPLSLKTYRQGLIDAGLTRGVINNNVDRAKRFFKWAVENELIPVSVYDALRTVGGLRRGRSAAPESAPVKPVPEEHIDAVIAQVNRHVAAMIQLQRLTGMRPGEVTIMRGRDLDTTGRIWTYTPQFHKTEHHDRERVIFLGPRAQRVIERFLTEDTNAYLFSPKRVVEEQRALVRAASRAPVSLGKLRRRRKRRPLRKPGEYYPVTSYEHAINKGCDKAFPVLEGLSDEEAKRWRKEHRWAPNRLRHSAATWLRTEFGIEAARVILGHASAAMTEVYAEMDRSKAADIMGQVG